MRRDEVIKGLVMNRDLTSRVVIGYRRCPAIAFSTKNFVSYSVGFELLD